MDLKKQVAQLNKRIETLKSVLTDNTALSQAQKKQKKTK